MIIGLLMIASFVAFIIYLVKGVISGIKKNGKSKRNFLFSAGAFVLMIIFVSALPSTQSNDKVATSNTQPKNIVTEKEENETVKAEAVSTPEPVKEVEGIDANGIYAVNDEIKPGLYRAEDGITYWARLSGFSGDMDEIIANGAIYGDAPQIVEIKKNDKGFQTSGNGNWVLVDKNYKPEKLKEFSDGMYMVGKDIDPGTYKTTGSVNYWSRLKDFSGSMDSILSNGNPDGPAIVEIKSSDVGFSTNGGGTWIKIK